MKAGKEFEGYVQYIYSRLLQLSDDKDTIVSTNVTIKGMSGARHEFDVYYEFTHLNLKIKVAIECKDWKNPITIGEVRDFCGKLGDLDNIVGVMVSKSGYQSGAITYGISKGVKLLEEKDLPSIIDIVLGTLKKGFLPDKSIEGRPFWTLMEVQKGEVTGTYYSLHGLERPAVLLFYSKIVAQHFRGVIPDSNKYEVRGIAQFQLKIMISLMRTQNLDVYIYYIPYWNEDVTGLPIIQIPIDKLEQEYVY